MSQHEGLKFLRDLQGEGSDGWVEVRTINTDGTRKQKWFKSAALLAEFVDSNDKRATGPAIYFGVGKRRSNGGGKKGDVLSIPAVWADIDTGKLGLDWQSVAKSLYHKPGVIRPSAIVHSGGGLHAYWFLHEPVELNDDNRDHVETVNAKVQRAMASDYVHDVSRVMRLPGTYNNKNKGKAARSFIVYSDWWDRYDLEEIDKAFTGLPIQIEGVKAPEKPGDDPRHVFSWMKEPGANGKKPNVETRLKALWDRTRYHGDGGDMRAGYVGINQAITYTTCLYWCSPTGGYSNEDSIVEMTLKWVKERKEIDAPYEHWNWNEEREMIRDTLERWKPKWQTIKNREELERKAARKKAKEEKEAAHG